MDKAKLLRASHIYPWKLSDQKQKLDKFNGLLLTPNLDQAFDQGLISFDSAGNILINNISDDDLLILNIQKSMKLRHLKDEHEVYLRLHRRLHCLE